MSKNGFIQVTLTAYNAVNFNANNKKEIYLKSCMNRNVK